MNLKQAQRFRLILSPFIVLYIAGFIGISHWSEIINEIHEYGKEEGKNNIWFAKKCIWNYLYTAFLTIVNSAVWVLTIYWISYWISK